VPLSITTAAPEDEPEIIALWHACGLVTPYNDPFTDLRFAQVGATSDVLVGKTVSGAVGGAVMVGHDGHRGWLYYVAVAPDARGQGFGRQMVQAATDWLHERGVPKAQLMIRETNPAVTAFYERLGFELTPRIVMAKWLRNDP